MTIDRDALVRQVADDVTELVDPRDHVEPYRKPWPPGSRKVRWFGHRVPMPSLLDQLRAGGAPAASEGGAGRGFESRPPHEQNAFDCYNEAQAIADGAAWWIAIRGRPLRLTAEDNLRAIVGEAPRLRHVDLEDVARDVARWKFRAQVLTGWKTPPWTPRATCPHCERKGGLRIRLDERQAACLACGSMWDQGSIGVLAEHIRTEGERDDEKGDTPDEQRVC